MKEKSFFTISQSLFEKKPFCAKILSMHGKFETFYFEDFEISPENKEIILKYSFDGAVFFDEIFSFEIPLVNHFSHFVLSDALFGLWVMAGISYFKAALPKKIAFRDPKWKLTASQKEFFEKIYLNGLGEFFYENKIDPKGVINFPAATKSIPVGAQDFEPLQETAGILLPIGGGKDSLVSAEILKTSGEEITTWTVGTSAVLKNSVQRIGAPTITVTRKISSQLIELNKQGALNGHVPISAILAFLSVVTAILSGKKYIALSNEASANFGNADINGWEVNHQYSKSLEFELDFQKYVAENITPEIKYFSLLRPFSELKIAKLFVEKCWDKYGDIFSSCNRNFQITRRHDVDVAPSEWVIWCRECSKCAFVALIFAPFVERVELEKLFGAFGEFVAKNEKHIEELLGLSGHKPFECVGEEAEVREAVWLAQDKYPELKKFAERFEKPTFDIEKMHHHALPEKFAQLISYAKSNS
jgi:hypothetical protein